MNPIVKGILAVVAGFIAGSVVNYLIILLGPTVIPLPDGMNPMDPESIKEFMPQMKAINFVPPLLAHALGTLFGAFVAAKITSKMVHALIIGGLFLLGGIANIFMIPAPTWFIAVDLLLAYVPMALLGGMLAGAKN